MRQKNLIRYQIKILNNKCKDLYIGLINLNHWAENPSTNLESMVKKILQPVENRIAIGGKDYEEMGNALTKG